MHQYNGLFLKNQASLLLYLWANHFKYNNVQCSIISVDPFSFRSTAHLEEKFQDIQSIPPL